MGALADAAAVDEPAEEFDADAAAGEESPVTPTLQSSSGQVWDPAGQSGAAVSDDVPTCACRRCRRGAF